MRITKRKAIFVGLTSIIVALGFQVFNDVSCYKYELMDSLSGIWFPAIPLLPAVISLFTRNPLRAVGASAIVIPFYLMAYIADCTQPNQGGGASMIYVAVIMFGLPLATVMALITGSICQSVGIEIIPANLSFKRDALKRAP